MTIALRKALSFLISTLPTYPVASHRSASRLQIKHNAQLMKIAALYTYESKRKELMRKKETTQMQINYPKG